MHETVNEGMAHESATKHISFLSQVSFQITFDGEFYFATKSFSSKKDNLWKN